MVEAAMLCLLLGISPIFWACRPGNNPPHQEPVASALKRGEHVVVEPRAAEFLEARVLSVDQTRLRLELIASRESISAATGDVYRLPASAAKLDANTFAICKLESAWVGCKVLHVNGDTLSALTLMGATLELPRTNLLAATPLSELNLRQAFSRAETRLRFQTEAERAGQPVAPPGFRLQPHQRVIVRRAGAWYSAVVQEAKDEVVYVTFATSATHERVAPNDVVPEPPWPAQPARGDYVLVRPLGPAEPWPTLRVAGISEREFHVVDALGDERVVTHRDLLLLGSH
jgi:hypothetical protein